MSWTDALPAIGTFLGGPAGTLAGAGIEWIAEKLGASDKTVDGIKQTLAGMKPEDILAAKKLDIEFQQFCMDNGIKLQLAQLAVNAEEAKSDSLFKSGWRPAVGWVGVVSLACAYIPKALVLTAVWVWQAYVVMGQWSGIGPLVVPVFPDLGVTDMIGLLAAILGLGGLRSLDKFNKVV